MNSPSRHRCRLPSTISSNICAFSNLLHQLTSRNESPKLHLSSYASEISNVDLITLQEEAIQSEQVHVLSNDPLIYLIPNLLSEQECQDYQHRVQELQESRPMTRSNPPQVSLNVSKLWPLAFLSLGAGIPPIIRLQQSDVDLSAFELLRVALPSVAIALTASFVLAFGVVLPLIRKLANSKSRTSVAMALNLEDDIEFVRPLVKRLSQITNHAWQCWEAPVVTRYDPGAIFARHGDASPTRGSEWKDLGGQRIITCICYLNTVNEGGETYFDQLDLGVKPQAGQALVFFPADSTTWIADDRTTHESLPANEEKWIVQLFGRTERVSLPLGLPDSFGSNL